MAAHSISPRPLASAREICVPTFSDRVAVSAPALMARAFAMRRQRIRAAGPSPPVVSTPKGEKSQPAAWHVALLWTFFTHSASAAADDCPSRTADEAEAGPSRSQQQVCRAVPGAWDGLLNLRGPASQLAQAEEPVTEVVVPPVGPIAWAAQGMVSGRVHGFCVDCPLGVAGCPHPEP